MISVPSRILIFKPQTLFFNSFSYYNSIRTNCETISVIIVMSAKEVVQQGVIAK